MSAATSQTNSSAPGGSAAADAAALIIARGVEKHYEQGKITVPALRGVDVEIAEGEFTGLVGPSGSGKSTLLNILGGLDSPTKGSVSVDGVDPSTLNRGQAARFRLERIGFIFQAYNLLPVLTAYENAEYTLMLQGVPKAERRAIVMPLLERVGLGDEANRKPHELSGGQQQRVAVVRAIAPKPRVVLADEPTANLDSVTSGALLDLMAELNAEHGGTYVFASHDETVMRRCRRLVHLRDGLVERDERK